MSTIHLLNTLLASDELTSNEPVLKAPDRSVKFPEQATLLQDERREGKIFLTSLLLTSSLVTFALTSLPQIFSLAKLPLLTPGVQATATPLPNDPSSLLRLSQPISAQTVKTLTLTLSPTAPANVTLLISPTSGAKEVAIATFHLPTATPSKSYAVSVTIQPLPQ